LNFLKEFRNSSDTLRTGGNQKNTTKFRACFLFIAQNLIGFPINPELVSGPMEMLSPSSFLALNRVVLG